MAEYTTKYNLIKPSPQDFIDIAQLNGNSDKIDAALSAVDETAKAALFAASSAGGGIIKENVKAAAESFVADSVGGGYVCEVEITEATAAMYPIVTIHPSSREAAVAAGLSSVCETFDGKIRFHSDSAPTGDIYATLALIAHGGVGGSGGTAYMPIAGVDTLGGIKIGDGLSVEEDGTLSTNPRLTFATDEEVDAVINEILNNTQNAGEG